MWDPQIGELGDRFRCLLVDHPGHGKSPTAPGPYTIAGLADGVVAALDRVEVDRAHVVGLSIGAMIGMALAIDHPDRVDRLALLCTSAQLGPPSAWEERAAAVRAGGTSAIAETVVGRWLSPAYRDAHPDEFAELVAMVSSVDRDGYAWCCEAIAAMDLRADLPGVARADAGRRRRARSGDAGRARRADRLARSPARASRSSRPPTWRAGSGRPRSTPCWRITCSAEGAADERPNDDPYEAGHAGAPRGARRRARRPGRRRHHRPRRRLPALHHRRRRGARCGPGTTASTAAPDRASRSPCSPRCGPSTSWGCTSAPGCATGSPPEEITEVILHTAAYAGIPAANTAMAVAKEVLADDPP